MRPRSTNQSPQPTQLSSPMQSPWCFIDTDPTNQRNCLQPFSQGGDKRQNKHIVLLRPELHLVRPCCTGTVKGFLVVWVIQIPRGLQDLSKLGFPFGLHFVHTENLDPHD